MNPRSIPPESQKKRRNTSRSPAPSAQQRGRRRRQSGRPLLFTLLVLAGALLVLAGVFWLNHAPGGGGAPSTAATGQADAYPFQVGQPGPGAQAPTFTLPSTAGGTFSLSALRGKTVLLYFQEGLTCQPCWDQLKDIQGDLPAFRALGVNQVVSITTDPLSALQQKVADEELTIPVLSDPTLAVSTTYSANQYGMMGTSRDGHTFVLVGPDGKIVWRADYGGAPKYIMYVPVPTLLADLHAGMAGK